MIEKMYCGDKEQVRSWNWKIGGRTFPFARASASPTFPKSNRIVFVTIAIACPAVCLLAWTEARSLQTHLLLKSIHRFSRFPFFTSGISRGELVCQCRNRKRKNARGTSSLAAAESKHAPRRRGCGGCGISRGTICSRQDLRGEAADERGEEE